MLERCCMKAHLVRFGRPSRTFHASVWCADMPSRSVRKGHVGSRRQPSVQDLRCQRSQIRDAYHKTSQNAYQGTARGGGDTDCGTQPRARSRYTGVKEISQLFRLKRAFRSPKVQSLEAEV